MTREESMEIITNALQSDESKYTEKIDKALALAQKALEQDPCEDAISRQAVKDMLDARGIKAIMTFEHFKELLDKLPSVTPKPKTGHWIPDDTICEDTLYRCSNCDNVYYSDYGDVKNMGYNYCPNCGAKMESEVQDEISD